MRFVFKYANIQNYRRPVSSAPSNYILPPPPMFCLPNLSAYCTATGPYSGNVTQQRTRVSCKTCTTIVVSWQCRTSY